MFLLGITCGFAGSIIFSLLLTYDVVSGTCMDRLHLYFCPDYKIEEEKRQMTIKFSWGTFYTDDGYSWYDVNNKTKLGYQRSKLDSKLSAIYSLHKAEGWIK